MGMELAETVYKLTEKFPVTERYGLTQQVQRASVSVPSNIAEGAYRNSDKEFKYFLGIAAGSAGEVYTQLELACRLGYLNRETTDAVLDHADMMKRMIFNFQKQL